MTLQSSATTTQAAMRLMPRVLPMGPRPGIRTARRRVTPPRPHYPNQAAIFGMTLPKRVGFFCGCMMRLSSDTVRSPTADAVTE